MSKVLSTEQIEAARTELNNLYRDVERDLLTATSRDRYLRILQNLHAIQRVLDMLPTSAKIES